MRIDGPDWQEQPFVAFGLMALFVMLLLVFLAG